MSEEISTDEALDNAETARQLQERCEHGVLVLDGPVCRECDEYTPPGWVTAPCASCGAPMGDRCQNGGCCSGCRHSVQPPGRGVRKVYSRNAGRMVSQVYDLATGEAI